MDGGGREARLLKKANMNQLISFPKLWAALHPAVERHTVRLVRRIRSTGHTLPSVAGRVADWFSGAASKRCAVLAGIVRWIGTKCLCRVRPGDEPEPKETDTAHLQEAPTDILPSSEAPSAGELAVDNDAVMRHLQKAAQGLVDICAATEADFLGLGTQLHTIHAESQQLTQSVMTSLGAEQGHTIQRSLRQIQAHAAEALQELNQRRETLLDDLVQLKSIQADLAHLVEQNKGFRRVAKNLKMVGLSISIESARSEAAKGNFHVLAKEIAELAQTVHTVAGDIRDDTVAARQNIEAIQTAIALRTDHLQTLIRSAEAAVEQALQEVERLTQLTVAVLDGIGTEADEIARQVGQLVMSIQIHDNISQRAAHIKSAVRKIVELIETGTAADVPLSHRRQTYGKAYGINRLQIAQLQIIIEDVADVRDRCRGALEGLLVAVKEMGRPQGQKFPENDDHQHPMMLLRDALGQIVTLFDAGLDDIRKLTEARQDIRQAIALMDRHIDKVSDINFDIRLKALNGVVKSSRLGGTGKAIAALVNEMKAIAEQSNMTIAASTDIMGRITAASERMDRTDRHIEIDVTSADRQLRSGISEYTAACEAFEEQSRATLATGSALERMIVDAAAGLDFFDRMVTECQHHIEDVTAVDALLRPFADDVPADWIEEEQSILQRYTMQRERDAHCRLFDGDRGDGVPEICMTSEEKIEEELDDNVELF